MSYNLTGIAENSTNMVTLLQGVNSNLMDGYLGILFLIGIFVVLLTSFMFNTKDWRKSLGPASFACFILSVLLRAMSLVPTIAVFIFAIIMAGSIAFIWRE